ncbi:MAG: hypothetical protein ACOYO1_18600 [Bacteroidales bacterium]
MTKLKYIIYGFLVILFDIAIYIVLGLQLMKYDDFYTESKGEYWSFASMTFSEKMWTIGINIWNVINLIVIGFFIYRLIKGIIKTRHNSTLLQAGFNNKVK